MKRLTLVRYWHDAERTLGEISHSGKHIAYTLEPGLEDKAHPRVPSGFYHLERHGWEPETELRYKRTWALVGRTVAHQEGDDGWEEGMRSAVLFHSGNRDDDTLGCILLGSSIGRIEGETGVLGSKKALERLRELIGEAEAYLVVRGA